MFEQVMSFSAMQGVRRYLETRQAFDSKNTWYTFLSKMVDKVIDNDTAERAASVAFNLILAVFPTIIFLFTLIPYIPYAGLDTQILEFFGRVLPGDTYQKVEPTIRDIISRPNGGVLSVGFLLAFYSATSGVVSLMNAFNSSHRTGEQRTFLKTRLIAVGLMFVLVFGLVLAIILLVIGGVVTEYLTQFGFFRNEFIVTLLGLSRYLIVFFVFVGIIAVVYRYGPDVDMKWRFVTPGGVTAAVLIVLTTLGFSYYVSNFGSYNKVYGSIGTLIALMIWTNLVSLMMIMGFEMNVSLYNLEGEKNPNVADKVTEGPSETTNATLKT